MLSEDRNIRSGTCTARRRHGQPHVREPWLRRREPWPTRFTATVEAVGIVLLLAGAFLVGTRSGPATALGLFLCGYAALALACMALRVLLWSVASVVPLRRDSMAETEIARRWRPEAKAPRPLKFRATGGRGGPPPLSTAARVHLLAARAADTVDLLTRRPLAPGDAVFVCLGRQGECGAVFHQDIRSDLVIHHADRCPACGSSGAFLPAVIPAPPAVPPPLPAAPLEPERRAVPTEPAPPEAADPARSPRRLVFRVAS